MKIESRIIETGRIVHKFAEQEVLISHIPVRRYMGYMASCIEFPHQIIHTLKAQGFPLRVRKFTLKGKCWRGDGDGEGKPNEI